MTKTKAEVHISDVRAFKSCRRAWQWSSPLGKNLEPDKPYAPFFMGRIVHTALELFYRSDGNMSLYGATEVACNIERNKMELAGTLWDSELEMMAEQTELIYHIMEHYEIWINSKEQQNAPWGDGNLEFIDMETNFVVPLFSPSGHKSTKVKLGGRFDGIVRKRDDSTLWLFETKTTRSIMELQKTLAFDEQAGGYIYAAQQMMGEQVYGVIYNIMRKKKPTTPRVLKNGMLSKNMNIDTTMAYYWYAIQEHHPDCTREDQLEEYKDILAHLREKGNTFFSRTVIRRTPGEINELVKNLHTVSLEMTRPSTPMYPSPGWTNCTFCRFTAPCLAYNSGADYESILLSEYRERKDRILRPYLLYGFHFVPLADDYVSVWYYDEPILEAAPDLVTALAETCAWIGMQERNDRYVGPEVADLLRGAKEIGLWQND